MKLLFLAIFFPVLAVVVLSKLALGLMFLTLKAGLALAVLALPFLAGYAVGRSSPQRATLPTQTTG